LGQIESPTRRAYHLCALLCGQRLGELALLKWVDALARAGFPPAALIGKLARQNLFLEGRVIT